MYSTNVNEFDTDKLEWKEIGRMKIGRQQHAISKVEVNEEFLKQNCLTEPPTTNTPTTITGIVAFQHTSSTNTVPGHCKSF